MKIWAKVTASGTEKGALIQTFGEEFSSENGIVINGDVAIVELVFEDRPPQKILGAIANSNVVVFKFGKLSEECLMAIEEGSTSIEQQEGRDKEEGINSSEVVNQEIAEPVPEEKTKTAVGNDENVRIFQDEPHEQSISVEEHESEEEAQTIPELALPEMSMLEESKGECSKTAEEKSVEKSEEHTDEKFLLEPNFEAISAESSDKANESGKAQRKSRFATTSAQLEEKVKKIAEKSVSYDNFVENVEDWLNLDSDRRGYVLKSLIVVEKVAKLTWSSLESELTAAGFSFEKSDKRVCEKKLSAVCDGEANFLGLLKLLNMYKTFEFNGIKQIRNSIQMEFDNCLDISEKADEPSSSSDVFSRELESEHIQEPKEERNVIDETTDQQERGVLQKQLKMECMPEIPVLDDALIKAGEEQNIVEKVKIVLEACGLKSRKSKEQKYILAIACAAVEMDQLDIEDLISRAGIPNNSAYSVRMSFAQMINNFVQKNNHTQKVKLDDFLKDLKRVVMS